MIAQIALATGFILFLIGLYGALTQRNLLRMIVAFTVADAGVNLVIVAVGYMPGRTRRSSTAPCPPPTPSPGSSIRYRRHWCSPPSSSAWASPR
jgi:multisubunit Na+/H+ antiporter MnhC subunit